MLEELIDSRNSWSPGDGKNPENVGNLARDIEMLDC